jgi:hypothetical protein
MQAFGNRNCIVGKIRGQSSIVGGFAHEVRDE